jgi:hypothetical protein
MSDFPSSQLPELESERFQELLAEALRSGPGSPEWHAALQALGRGGGSAAQEYRLLCTAREHLESGREYRAVRAGAGFTRQLFSAIENEPVPRAWSPPTATLIALVSAGVLLLMVAVVGVMLMRSASPPPTTDEMGQIYFANTLLSAELAGEVPAGWRQIGTLPLSFDGEMRPLDPTEDQDLGGGIVTASGLSPGGAFAIEATIVGARNTQDIIPHIFLTDQPSFSPERASSAAELVCLLHDARPSVVLPDGRVQPLGDRIRSRQSIVVRLIFDRDQAAIELDGKRIWTGEHQLSKDRPRYVGVRLLRRAGAKPEPVAIQSVRVLKP